MRVTELKKIVDRFKGKRLLVVGDIMLDEYIWGEVNRISPEAPVPVVQFQRRNYIPGGAANTSANVTSLGGEVFLNGVVGKDREGEHLLTALQAAGVNIDGLVTDDSRPTTTKTRIIAQSQQVARLDRETRAPLPEALEDNLLARCQQRMRAVDVCILSDYAKGVLSPRLTQALIKWARGAGKPTVVDPKGSDYSKYRGATVIKPNLHEVQQVLGQDMTDECEWQRAGERLTRMLDGTTVLMSCGAKGMVLFRPGQLALHIPSTAKSVFDVTGAGDTVVGTVALALAAGASLEQAAHLANRAAGIVVGKVGTAFVSNEELRARLRGHRRPKASETGTPQLSPLTLNFDGNVNCQLG
jgi:D-beta-D-heptose 7-phosphate kinase/D-beta-D-heptose 1-phosphate adenosyltransferase